MIKIIINNWMIYEGNTIIKSGYLRWEVDYMLEKGFYQYIRKIRLDNEGIDSKEYPFCLKAVQELRELELHPNVTFIIGENGSGKSTLLEAIATAFGFNTEGGSKNFNFSTLDTHSSLSQYLRLTKGVKKPKDGYFLRAESFYNVASNIEELDKEGFSPPIINSYGGISLHEQSHGESFMSLITHRFGGNGLYILDEIEAALSPTRQLALVRRIHELVMQDSQFIIATHSPIIMGYPNATIYSLDDNYKILKYDETEHFTVMKNFMNNTQGMLRYLMED